MDKTDYEKESKAYFAHINELMRESMHKAIDRADLRMMAHAMQLGEDELRAQLHAEADQKAVENG